MYTSHSHNDPRRGKRKGEGESTPPRIHNYAQFTDPSQASWTPSPYPYTRQPTRAQIHRTRFGALLFLSLFHVSTKLFQLPHADVFLCENEMLTFFVSSRGVSLAVSKLMARM